MFKKAISLILSISLVLTQPVFAQGVAELNIGKYLNQMPAVKTDSFRPAHLRYVSYDIASNDFKLLLDQGDAKLSNSLNSSTPKLQESTQELFNYFLIGLSLPNDKFWVNLRPDAPEQIIDPLLEKTDMGKIMLEADLQLKKDTSSLTSPQNPEGKEYWDKLYKKAGELFPAENITIPTITRPWIVPGEVIIRESEDSAYIYKANLKVMLEEDYLNNQKTEKPKNQKTDDYNFSDPRLKELNKYSTQLIKELILPRLTQEVNTSKKYAQLRQVFFSLILSRWFKDRYREQVTVNSVQFTAKDNSYLKRIDSGNLTDLVSKESWSKDYYFSEYKKSFQQGEYNLKEQVSTPTGQVIRSYVSGGISPVLETRDVNGFTATAASPISDKWLVAGAIVWTIGGLISGLILINEIAKVIEIRPSVELLEAKRKTAIHYMLSANKIDTILFAINKDLYETFSQTDFQTIEDFRNWLEERKGINRKDRDKIEIKLFILEEKMRPWIRKYLDDTFKELNSFKETSNSVKTDKISLQALTRGLLGEFNKKKDSIKDYGALLGLINELVALLDKAYKEEKGYVEKEFKAMVSDGLSSLFEDAIKGFRNMELRVYKAIPEGSSPLAPQTIQAQDAKLETGGIDFTRINYLTQPMGSFRGLDLRLPRLSKAELEGIDINRELAAIEQMINARIEVSTDRLKRLLAAMSQKDAFTVQRETQLLPLLLRLCWLKEERGTETTPDFRAVLLIADTGLFVEQADSQG